MNLTGGDLANTEQIRKKKVVIGISVPVTPEKLEHRALAGPWFPGRQQFCLKCR